MRRPPYAKLMIERAADPRNRSQSHWVLIGADAWNKAAAWSQEQHRVFTVCPPGEDPKQFDWSIYRNAPPPVGLVRCGDVDGKQVQALVKLLLSAGSPRVYDLSEHIAYNVKKVAA